MSEDSTDALQFDRLVTGEGAETPEVGVTCAGCHAPIDTEYYQVNARAVCASCRDAVEHAARTPQGIGPFMIAGLMGLGAAIAGAVVYYAVIAVTNLEIGLIAILCGYMVGYAVRKGARGGGRAFQVLAVTLTYLSVALAYAPLALRSNVDDQAVAERSSQRAESLPRTSNAPTLEGPADVVADGQTRASVVDPSNADQSPWTLRFLLLFTGLVLALPILSIVTALPSGLISAAIIGFGMHQAWKMTGAPDLRISGPYRVGASQEPAAT